MTISTGIALPQCIQTDDGLAYLYEPAPVHVERWAQEHINIVFSAWWQGDPLPFLPALPGLRVTQEEDYRLLAELAHLQPGEVLARVETGHRPYVAWMAATPVAYGWSAVEQASIGEVGLSFEISQGDRYLWDFATLPAWRGRGVYPRLLQAILEREAAEAARFWIGHLRENHHSARGITKAGFRQAGTLLFYEGQLGFVPTGPQGRAAARLLGTRALLHDHWAG